MSAISLTTENLCTSCRRDLDSQSSTGPHDPDSDALATITKMNFKPFLRGESDFFSETNARSYDVDALLSGASLRLQAIDIKTRDLRLRLEALEREKSLLSSQKVQLESLKAPVRMLSNDVLLEIFQAVPMPSVTLAANGSGTFKIVSTISNISAVCYRWREVATSSPILWSTIQVSHAEELSAGRSEKQLYTLPHRFVEMCMANASACPLDIHFSDYSDVVPPPSHLISSIFRNPAQLRYLDLETYWLVDPIFANVPSFPLLESLTLRLGATLDTDPLCTSCFINSPRLRKVTLESVSFARILLPWAQIRTLELSSGWYQPYSEQDVLQFLEGTPQLEYFQIFRAESTSSWPSRYPIKLEHLKYLGLAYPPLSDHYEMLLNSISCPNLETLEITSMDRSVSENAESFLENISMVTQPYFREFISRCPHLQELEMDTPCLSSTYLLELFPLLPNLTRFQFAGMGALCAFEWETEIGDTGQDNIFTVDRVQTDIFSSLDKVKTVTGSYNDLTTQFFERLTLSSSTAPATALLPRLEHLDMGVVLDKEAQLAALAMIRSRFVRTNDSGVASQLKTFTAKIVGHEVAVDFEMLLSEERSRGLTVEVWRDKYNLDLGYEVVVHTI